MFIEILPSYIFWYNDIAAEGARESFPKFDISGIYQINITQQQHKIFFDKFYSTFIQSKYH